MRRTERCAQSVFDFCGHRPFRFCAHRAYIGGS
ncbi:hypothetical protein FHS92_002214 [Sphingobium subterraneum]|uniref:Uncharacterized protein n=1 Tax=Sphingobium subterraneum TaxID=627688 RepID=A0A841IZS3_9SPHN|nr:hypothetical protein [Sphingobium subterraneum]